MADIFGQGFAVPGKISSLGMLSLSAGEDRLLDSVESIICTPRGTCPLDPKFGVDFEAYDVIEDVDRFAWHLTRAIEYGEPRIDRIDVIKEAISVDRGLVSLRIEIWPRGGLTPLIRTFPFYRKV